MKTTRYIKSCLLVFFLVMQMAKAGEFTAAFDNDVFFDEDKHYTHGSYFSLSYRVEPYCGLLGYGKEVNYERLYFL